MKKKLFYFLGILIILGFFHGCYEESGEDLLFFESPFDSKPTEVFEIVPGSKSAVEINKGKYMFAGALSKGTHGEGGLNSDFPDQLSIGLVLSTPKESTHLDQAKNVKRINIHLQVDPKTGNIPQQSINIRKTMIIDPGKNESLKVLLSCKNGTINIGDSLRLTRWNEDADPFNITKKLIPKTHK